MHISIRNLNSQQCQAVEVRHDRSGRADIYYAGPRFGLLNKAEAYELARALVDLADTLPEG